MTARFLAAPLLALAVVAAPVPQSQAGRTGLAPKADSLWSLILAPILRSEPWRDASRYDAAHVLMLPLHAAFSHHFEMGERGFAEHFRRFHEVSRSVRLDRDSEVSWLQYLYLASRFAALSADHGHRELVPKGLPLQLRKWVAELWQDHQARHWTQGPFHGFGARVRWKLAASRPAVWERSYPRAILDSEQFLFAIAADLRHYGRVTGSPLAGDALLDSIADIALQVYRQRVVWGPAGGWTFQPGVWRDHKDFRYACREDKSPDLRPCILADVAEDASHSHRSPLWLRSLADGSPPASPERHYYLALADGLERQFFGRVLEPPSPEFDGWRLHNFMDGRNGIYRWGYASLGPEQGYGAFELSGTLLHGWWAFLPGERTRKLYQDLAERFPLPAEQVTVYAGPASRRDAAGALRNGLAELLCRLAAGLPGVNPGSS